MLLRQGLAHHFPDIPISLLPRGFDKLGDIALLTLPKDILPFAERIGEIILGYFPHLHVVALRVGEYTGLYRLPKIRVIAGESRLTTVHRENGINLYLNLEKAYFSTRLAQERMRVAKAVRPHERVCVLCSGLGPFPLNIASHSKAQEVIGIEVNPWAHALALQNRLANRKTGGVRFFAGQAAAILPLLRTSFDRIVLMLPTGSAELVPWVLPYIRAGGTIHYYAMQEGGKDDISAHNTLAALCLARGYRLLSSRTVLCGHCGPKRYRVCIDAIIDHI